MRRFMSFVTGAFCGALVGSLTAILLAPSSGDEMRSKIRARVASVGAELRQAYDSRVAQLEAELEGLRRPRA